MFRDVFTSMEPNACEFGNARTRATSTQSPE